MRLSEETVQLLGFFRAAGPRPYVYQQLHIDNMFNVWQMGYTVLNMTANKPEERDLKQNPKLELESLSDTFEDIRIPGMSKLFEKYHKSLGN